MSARLVAIEGIDGSGKGTQAHRLRDAVTRSGRTCSVLAFPQYSETLFGRTVARYLNGEFGDLRSAGAHFAALLYAGDRFESLPRIEQFRNTVDLVIFDRYVPSNLAHQAAKLPPEQRPGFIEWLDTIEYGVYRLPRPDLVIYLDMPVAQARSLILQKPARAYTAKSVDLHEADGEYLEQTAAVYRQLSGGPGWQVVPCTSGDQLRTVESIASDVFERVRGVLGG